MKKITLLLFALFFVTAATFSQNVTIPDANFKAALLADNLINTTADGEITVAEANAYTGTIEVSGKSITSLVGIEAFVNITVLNCSANSLTTLDVTPLTKLERLYCNENKTIKNIKLGSIASLKSLISVPLFI